MQTVLNQTLLGAAIIAIFCALLGRKPRRSVAQASGLMLFVGASYSVGVLIYQAWGLK